MRQLSLRPDQKLRGVKRRLRALNTWASAFEGWFPREDERDSQFNNFKIPVLDRLVRPPQTNRAIQAACITELLRAAQFLAAAKPAALHKTCRIGVLLTLPDMWHSEVTVFYERDYYRGFLHEDAAYAGRSICAEFGIVKPERFIENGSLVQWDDTRDDGTTVTHRSEWWTIGEAL